jgi:hypothetical protein
MWTSKLARIARDQTRLACTLADLGVLPRSMPPEVGPRDGRSVIDIKEQMIALHRRREAILASLGSIGAVMIDHETLEIVLPGGPEEGTYLSWQPGEPRISWWRNEPSTSSTRRPLPGAEVENGPILH